MPIKKYDKYLAVAMGIAIIFFCAAVVFEYEMKPQVPVAAAVIGCRICIGNLTDQERPNFTHYCPVCNSSLLYEKNLKCYGGRCYEE